MSSHAQATSEQFGQSIWYDNVQRGALENGEFAKLVAQGVRGCTSNPTIFHNAIAGSADYDQALRHLVSEGRGAEDIYYHLVVDDIRGAADALYDVYQQSQFKDGYVSVEVQPKHCRNTQETITEALALHRMIGRRNVMIKVPATEQGLLAVSELIGAGIPVNVTLIFSQQRYAEVAQAYIAGLKKAHARGLDLSRIASVASFFVSRIDSAVDALLAAKSNTELQGKIAVANAKLAYERFGQLFSGDFESLAQAGAQKQRVLWASTGTKNPDYSDTLYVDELMGPETVNTVPPKTLQAFQAHGTPGASLTQDVNLARQQIEQLETLGISLQSVCDELLEKGLTAFITSMDNLMDVIAARRQALMEQSRERQSYALGNGAQAVIDALGEISERSTMSGIWKEEPKAFTDDESAVASIKNRLGWLNAPKAMLSHVADLSAFAKELHEAGFRKALLLGMGGSSLCPEVMALSFGKTPGFLELKILDSTDPESVSAAQAWAELDETLFIVASKSGSTIEVRSFAAHFWALVEAKYGEKAGSRFIAITDSGSPLTKLAQEKKYRRTFENPGNIGGRFSALSLFGLVPAALMGVDLERLLDDADRMAQSCDASVPAQENPGARLGAFMGGLGRTGRDKLTLITSDDIKSLGSWIEQLVAESTGKHGVGVVPIDLETVAAPASYSQDRAFVYIRSEQADNTQLDEQVKALIGAGHPVATLGLFAHSDLGGEFYRWEMATAVAGALFHVNPFDEPNVTEAKTATKALIAEFENTGKLPQEPAEQATSSAVLDTVKSAKDGDYVVFSAYFRQTPERDAALQKLRDAVQTKLGRPSTLGYGPRFLHSTGQLHKGGPNKGVFVVLTSSSKQDIPIPGEKYSFKVLIDAQATGDLQVLKDPHKRRAVQVDLGEDVNAGLEALVKNFSAL